ncbi:MAG TPA: hypothetical protein VJ789_09225 [Burkholderiales bacterium]|nr:hypothetical protein [Burkholderiales bacterium]
MREFSRRTTDALRLPLALRAALPALEPFLAENVAKEIRKDALVIRRAASGPAPGAAREVLDAAREIDREFLERIGGLPLRIRIPYDRIEPLRLRRIELGLDTAGRILDAWRQRRRLRQAFAPGELEQRVHEMLRLYAEETLALSDAVSLPGILVPLRRRLAERLRDAMREAASSLLRGAPAAEQKG